MGNLDATNVSSLVGLANRETFSHAGIGCQNFIQPCLDLGQFVVTFPAKGAAISVGYLLVVDKPKYQAINFIVRKINTRFAQVLSWNKRQLYNRALGKEFVAYENPFLISFGLLTFEHCLLRAGC